MFDAIFRDHPPTWKRTDLAFDALMTYALAFSPAEHSAVHSEIDQFLATDSGSKETFVLEYASEWQMTTKRSVDAVLKPLQAELRKVAKFVIDSHPFF